tara:strand:- start:340 stop:549 length:210 start_codon:yes stop_codon:yes gene_type:complete
MSKIFLNKEAENLEKEYLKQYPNEESPFNWFIVFSEDEIVNFVKNRKGRKIGLKTEKDVLDGGELIYIE